jgi:hypothetical protein
VTLSLQRFMQLCWPRCALYSKQQEVRDSVERNRITMVPGCNKSGKDYLAGRLAIAFFCTRSPCRIVTTSAKSEHLMVLWGEIEEAIRTSEFPLTVDKGGPLIVNHRHIKRVYSNGDECPLSYIKGMVASGDTIASMQGHHIAETGDGLPRTMMMVDECSSVADEYRKMYSTWADRIIEVGNTWPCSNFWSRDIEAGDMLNPSGDGTYYRKIVQITVEDSPNVRYARAQQRAGVSPDNTLVLPGPKSWAKYQEDLATMDEEEQCVKLWAKFYKGSRIMLCPEAVLMRCAANAVKLKGVKRKAKAIGIDAGEGSADTVFVVGDEYGIIGWWEQRTPDTSDIEGELIAFGRQYQVDPEHWVFDRGGGGKQIADYMRKRGFQVRTVGFGDAVSLDVKYGKHLVPSKREVREQRSVYKNRRSQMYGEFADMAASGYAIPIEFKELHRQLGKVPKKRGPEGELVIPSKRKRDPDSTEVTLTELLGRSPDQADAAVLMLHDILHKAPRARIGAA